MQWHDLVGSAGAAIILLSYSLLQFERLSSTAISYSLLNAMGAALILISLMIDFNLSAFIVEGFWLLISVIGVARCLLLRDSARL